MIYFNRCLIFLTATYSIPVKNVIPSSCTLYSVKTRQDIKIIQCRDPVPLQTGARYGPNEPDPVLNSSL